MQYLKSISLISKVYATTGSKPVLVMCNDLEHYVCKYNISYGRTASKLFREYIGACFLKQWNLSVPDFAFVEISEDHIGELPQLQPQFFKTICFGSRYDRNCKEADKFLSFIEASDRKLFINKNDYLKIALFDIWMSNEDRNYGNYNLMLNLENSYEFVPIDHEMIFNTGNLDKGLYLISESDSIINTPFTRRLYTKKELADKKNLKSIKEEYYLCVNNCQNHLNTILENIPDDWLVNIDFERELLQKELFNPDWIKNVYYQFLTFIQSQIR